MQVTIVGPGNMGRALTSRFVAGGNDVTLVGRDRQKTEEIASDLRQSVKESAAIGAADAETAIGKAEAVILALPYQVALESARTYASLLADKIVVDITNPLTEDYSGLLTEGGPSGAETIRSQLPNGTKIVKAFNTTFARTLVDGVVSGQPLDVFIAGDDDAANGRVTELVRGGGLRPVAVGGLERARQLEALGFLGISLQEPLGTGYMTGWKLIFPGTAGPQTGAGFPRNAVVGVLPNTGPMGDIVTEASAIGVSQTDVHLLMGAEGAAVLRSARQGSAGTLGSLFGYEGEHTRRHLKEVEAGNVVVVVEVGDETVGNRVGEILRRHGASFAHYYSRWTARSLIP